MHYCPHPITAVPNRDGLTPMLSVPLSNPGRAPENNRGVLIDDKK